MNISETLQLLDKLKEVGASRFQDGQFEVVLNGVPAPKSEGLMAWLPEDVKPAPQPPTPAPKPPTTPYNDENTKKMQALIDLLKMKDEELANKIFPEGA